jgi:hypothetical protein
MPDTWRPAGGYGPAGPVENRLRGTGLVADDLWLLAHHELTGRPLLHPRPLGLGLAAALLAELMLTEPPAITIAAQEGGVVRVSGRVPGHVAGGEPLVKQIAAEPAPHPVRDWLRFLARTAAGIVAARLEQAGYLVRGRRLVPWLAPRLAPADPDWAYTPVIRAGTALDPRREWGPGAGVLAGLAVACGLGFRLGQYTSSPERAVPGTVARLPASLQHLILQTQTAAAAAVLSRT